MIPICKPKEMTIDDLFQSYSTTKPTDFSIYKFGNMIHINRCVFTGITGGTATVGYIKSKYRPAKSLRLPVAVGGGSSINGVMFVDPDGKVSIGSTTSFSNSSGYVFSGSWIFE